MWKRAAIAGLLLIVALLILLESSTFQQWLLRRSGIPISARTFDLNWWDLQGTLEDVVYEENGVRITADRMVVEAPWNALNGEVIVVNHLEIDGLAIQVRSPEPAIPEPSGDEVTGIPRIRFDRLIVRDGSLDYDNQSMQVRIPEFSLDVTEGRGTLLVPQPIEIPPDTRFEIREIPVVVANDSLEFGPSQWALFYTEYNGRGSAQGRFAWSPAVTFTTDFSTEPITVENFENITATGNISVEDGVLRIADLRARQGDGELTGSAEISDESKSATAVWNNFALDPLGIQGNSQGNLELEWTASDFSDISGTGTVTATTREYGRVNSDVLIQNGRANLNLTANAFDAAIDANVVTGLDRTLAGTFRVVHTQYGRVTVRGNLDGTWSDPLATATLDAQDVTYDGIGPIDATAAATFRDNVVAVSNIDAVLNESRIEDGTLTANLDSRRILGDFSDIRLQLADFVTDGMGEILATAIVEGTIDGPAARFSANSNGLDIGGTHIDTLMANGRYRDNIVYLDGLQATQAQGQLQASGTVNTATEAVAANFDVQNLQIVDLRGLTTTVFLDGTIGGGINAPTTQFQGQLRDVVYQGQMHGNLTVNGTTAGDTATIRAQSDKYTATAVADVTTTAPYPFNATIDTNQSRIQYEQYNFVANGRVIATGQAQPFEISRLGFEGFTINGDGLEVSAVGTMGPGQAGVRTNVNAELSQIPIEGATLTGTARIAGTVRGTITDPEIEGALQTNNATIQTPDMPEPMTVVANVDFTRDQFLIRDMRSEIAGGTADITGRGTLDGTGEFDFVINGIRPERLFRNRPIGGLVSGRGSVQMTTPSLTGLSGTAEVTQLQLNVRDVAIQQAEPIRLSLQNQVLSLQSLRLTGPDTAATGSGTVNLSTGDLNLAVDADTNLRIVEALIPGSIAIGRLETRATIAGNRENPNVNGFINIRDTQFQIAEPPILLSEFDAQIQLRGQRLEITQAQGQLNGGDFTASGGTSFNAQGLEDAAIQMQATALQMEYPEGLQSEINSTLTLAGSSPALQIRGNVDITSGLYQEEIDLSEEVFARIANAAEAGTGDGDQPEFLEQIALDINVETPGLVTVSNNLVNIDMEGSFRVRGNAANPVLLGRAAVNEGGELYFGPSGGGDEATRRDRYVIETGTVEFNNPVRTEPTLDFVATHEMDLPDERYLVTLRVTGTPANLRTELTSDPFMPEHDIMAMLLTGRTYQELQGSYLAVAREQLANYLSGQISDLFGNAGAALGLDTVRLDPVGLASEEDPSARLTIGKDISKDFSLMFSQNLKNTQSQTWIVNYDAFRDLLLRAVNETDKKRVRLELRHDLRIGGGPALPQRVEPRDETVLGTVKFVGTTVPIEDLEDEVTEPGEPYNAYRMNQDIRELQEFFTDQEYLDAKVRGRRTTESGIVNVEFTIEEGPKVTFGFEGYDVSGGVIDDIRDIWIAGFSEGPSLRDSRDRLLEELRDDGYLEAQVEYREESPSPNARHFVFTIVPGREYDDPEWVLTGIEDLEVEDGDITIDITEDAGEAMADLEAIEERIEFELQTKGFLAADSSTPELIFEGERAYFQVRIDPGPQFSVGKLEFNGEEFFSARHLGRVVQAGPTDVIPEDIAGAVPEDDEELEPFPFTADWIETARQRVTSEYWAQGFNDSVIIPSTTWDRDTALVTVRFDITEGERQMISDVEIAGIGNTKPSYVDRQFVFKAGDPVDYSRINLTRKQLYDTRLFKRVDIDMVPGPGGYTAQVNLNEAAPLRIRYGIAVSNRRETSDRELGGTSDISYGNFFGKGVTLGLALKAQSQERDGRIYGSLPTFFGRNVVTTGTVFKTRDLTLPGVTNDLTGITIQQQWRLKDFYIFSYDYSYRRIHQFDPNPDPDNPLPLDLLFNISRLNTTLTRDTRDDILNSSRGTFFSNSFEIAPPGLGSNFEFIKNYTQYLRFKPVKTDWVWAMGVRVGTAWGLRGQEVIPLEQFFAGGGSTLRGFGQDDLAEPGNSVLILNQEIRVPLFWRIGGAAFFDAGNIYSTVRELKSWDLRYSPGLGLRVDTPFVLLRFDMGLNLWARAGEPPRQFVFGIGQAF